VETRLAQLTEENEALRRQVEDARRQNEQLRKHLDEKDSENASLRKEIDAWKRGFKERRKRRTSRSERAPRGARKKPGRPAGHPGAHRPMPSRIDDEIAHPAPAQCACGGEVEATAETRSTVVQDIPPVTVRNVRHTAHVGVCKACKKKVSRPLPGDVAAGRSVAQVQLGPHLQAMAVGLRYEQKVSLGSLRDFFGQWFGVVVTAGGLSQMVTRLADRSSKAYEEITRHVRSAPVVGADETGLRQDGKTGWCWLLRTDQASLFHVDASRGGHVFNTMLGEGFVGVVVSDFYSVYTSRTDILHGYCGAHTIREAKKLAELEPRPETLEFRDRLRAFYEAGAEAQASGDFLARRGARIRLGHLLGSTDFVACPDIVNLQERMVVHHEGVTRFLDNPAVPWHNNATETDIRAIARYRAMAGGTRSKHGSQTLAHWMSITQTRRKNRLPLGSFVRGVYQAHVDGADTPSVFAP
jgi:transposase